MARWWADYQALADTVDTYADMAEASPTYADAGWSGVATMEKS